ncbi:hypothetical protein GDO86_008908 [Hymenochirus boettgeri]|uniref:Protein SPT2 homolog n=1 Tax=Hymenochirus boettgeri TaxID=247094 RepID=A0A8T2J7J9_9PIPI|nr:hypothetical protein GDO86_008908 [Hymenochirus boettgeri]
MDFNSVLRMAATQQDSNGTARRYSLAVGPPKKDPKVKGVQSAAVQAFLRKKEEEIHRKELNEKRKKEELLAKRKELKHDKKARAMASRTKDNFKGYNGIPIEDKPKKRRSSSETGSMDPNDNICTEEEEEYLAEEEMYEYSQTESEQEEVEEPPAPKVHKTTSVKKPPPSAMNFEDLLRLAEKKQYEPVEIIKPLKKEERPRTAEEIKELEFLERKAHKTERKTFDKEPKRTGQVVKVSKSSGEKKSSLKVEKKHENKSRSMEQKVSKPPVKSLSSKELGAKHSSSSRPEGSGNTNGKHPSGSATNSSRSAGTSNPISKQLGSVGSTGRSASSSSSGSARLGGHSSSSSGKLTAPSSSSSGRPVGGLNSISGRPTASPSFSSGRQMGSSGSSSGRPSGSSGRQTGSSVSSSGNLSSARASSSSSSAHIKASATVSQVPPSKSAKPSSGAPRPSSTGHLRTSSGSSQPPNSGGKVRPNSRPPSSGNPPKGPSPRPGTGSTQLLQNNSSQSSVRSSLGSGPGRPVGQLAQAKPKCTVVAETISSKNFIPKGNNGQINGMRGAIPPGQRSVMRPPGRPLPPITSSYKRRIEDEEDYDSEMEDFIDDGGECQDEISKHIREIFGYDKNRYKDESDYALRYMESSYREQQKEEARSLRMGIQEDLEELRREEEDLKRKAKQLKAAKKMKTQ